MARLGRNPALAGPSRARDHLHADGVGITVGYHRLFTHRSFKTTRPLRAIFAVLGAMAVEGPVIEWVATHRKHHCFSDHPGDPHSPHADDAPGWRGALRGLAHAHVGWMFRGKDMANPRRYAKDLLADRDLRFISRTFPLWVGVGLAVPFGLGVALTGTVVGRAHRPAVGRSRPRVPPASRDLQHQLAVPLLRRSAVRHRRRVAQSRVAGARSLSARPGTTTTTPSRPRPVTAWAAGSSTPAPGSSPGSSAATWPGMSSGSAPRASRPDRRRFRFRPNLVRPAGPS